MDKKIPNRPFAWFELEQLGLTRNDLRSLVKLSTVRPLLRGVYAPAALEDSIGLRARAAGLVLRDHMVLADRTAAWIHGVDRYHPSELTTLPDLDVVSIGEHNATRRAGTFGAERDLIEEEIVDVDGVRLTSPVRTSADLGCLFGRREALACLDAFMRVCGVTRAELDHQLERFRGRRGVVQLRELVTLATPKSESAGESWVRIEIHDAGLPAPDPQFWVVINGVPTFRLDLPYPQWKIVVEYDGEEFHTSPEDRENDRKRRDWLRRHGWIVIVVTKDDFRKHADGAWLRELKAALDERMPRRTGRRYARAERVPSRYRS